MRYNYVYCAFTTKSIIIPNFTRNKYGSILYVCCTVDTLALITGYFGVRSCTVMYRSIFYCREYCNLVRVFLQCRAASGAESRTSLSLRFGAHVVHSWAPVH